MQRISLPVTDLKTGEVVEKTFQEVRPPKPRLREFHFVKDEVLVRVAQDKLCGSDLRILMLLCGLCTWANQVHLTRKQIQQSLGLSRQQVTMSLIRLRDRGYLMFGYDNAASFDLHPGLVWKGKTEEVRAAIDRFEWILSRSTAPQ